MSDVLRRSNRNDVLIAKDQSGESKTDGPIERLEPRGTLLQGFMFECDMI